MIPARSSTEPTGRPIEDPERDAETRSCAFIALSGLGLDTEEVVGAVARGLGDPHWFVRGNAAGVAGAGRLDPERLVPLLVERLDDEEGHDWVPAEKALAALQGYGTEAAAAIPALEARLAELRARDSWDDAWIYPQELETTLAILRGEEPPEVERWEEDP